MKRGKKALSPIIATVLLIALVLVLASIIFLWAKGFLIERIEKFGQPVDQVCDRISFRADKVTENGMDFLEIANTGNVDLFEFDIKKIKGGNSEMTRFKYSIPSGQAKKESISLRMSDGTYPEKIVVYPTIIGKLRGRKTNKIFTCVNKGKVIVV